jgi:arabinofuranosyltransferase
LVPNTAFAKEPEASKWAWGWRYLTDFAKPYWLWLPLVLVGVVTVMLGRDRGRRDRVLLTAAPLAGLLHAFFVVRGGGDHMHARMLLPAWFALLLPAAAIPFRLPSRVALRVGAAFAVIALGAWALVPGFSGGPPYTGYGPRGIDDERSVWVARSDLHPVTVDDYARDGTYLARYFINEGRRGASLRREDKRVLFGLGFRITPTKRSAPAPVVAYGAIGMISVVGGPELYIADVYNLADPIGARFGPSRFGRPGHEKWTSVPWLVARYTEDAPVPEGVDPREVADARQALNCPIVRRLLARATAPLTPSRALTNVLDAFRLHDARISSTPAETARECAQNG